MIVPAKKPIFIISHKSFYFRKDRNGDHFSYCNLQIEKLFVGII
jgi:hypothetical protein